MNILFLTITPIVDMNSPSVHIGILKQFRDHGHEVYIVTPYERRVGKDTELTEIDGVHILHVKTGNNTKGGLIEKGISALAIDKQYYSAIKKYLINTVFSLILYSTPPITFNRIVKKLKDLNHATTYLMLKDIFPQNAVDIGIMKKGLIYYYFRDKEKKLYNISDYIGCMSNANVDYVLKMNDFVSKDKIEVCPNSIDIVDKSVSDEERYEIRKKYNIPVGNFVIVYGGNLGRPQGIPFVIECIDKVKNLENFTFLIVGDGTEYHKIEDYKENHDNSNLVLLKRLPKADYDSLVAACDVGMIFLDHRFTIPNFPSRLLGYMQAKIPVFAITDLNTDIGKVVVDGGFGWWCESNDSNRFLEIIQTIKKTDMADMKEKEYLYLNNNYSSRKAYSIIMSHLD